MQGRFKRGGGAGDPADRGPAVHQAPPTAASAPSGGSAGRSATITAQLGRITPPRVTGLRRYALSNWRIRTRLVALLVLPVIAAIVLGGLRIEAALQNAQTLSKVSELSAIAQSATTLADDLENERDTAAGPFTNPGNREDATVALAQSTTDAAYKRFTSLIGTVDLSALPGGGSDIFAVQQQLQQLQATRADAFPGPGDNQVIQQSVTEYDYPIVALIQLSQDLALGSSDSTLISSARALEQFSQAKDYVSVERAVLAAALASPGQVLSANDNAFLKHASDQYTTSINAFKAVYGAQNASQLITPWSNNTNIVSAERYVTDVTSSPNNGIKNAQQQLSSATWFDMASAQIQAMTSDQQALVQQLGHQAQTLRSQAESDTIVNSVLIALVLIVAVGGAALVGRSMVRTLRKLQETAEDVAEYRLPELVRTLSESDPQDADVSVEPIGINTSDEIGHVAHAFDKVHSEAVRLAAEQALLRGNINAMFTNLSRRSQGLIQRQLSLISELESREADPDQLSSLFKLDHLATRMRRNGENLLVLAGEDPGRRWTRPVPLVDVLRAAASEVEQYERIELASVPTADVVGRVVNDLVHLLAELLENATSFSSPQTRVRVTGHALPDGRVLVEIHDTGIGLSPDDLADINERLANPPVVDVSVSRRMGLFVVGRLSLRHGIRIQLRPSDSGGTTALVMLPVEITNAAERRGKGVPGQQAQEGRQVPGRPQGPHGQLGSGRPGAFDQPGRPGLGGPGELPGSGGPFGLPGRSGAGEERRPQLDGPGPKPAGPGNGLPPRGLPQRQPSEPAFAEAGWEEPAQHSAAGPDPRDTAQLPRFDENRADGFEEQDGPRGTRFPGRSPEEALPARPQSPAAPRNGDGDNDGGTLQFARPRFDEQAPDLPRGHRGEPVAPLPPRGGVPQAPAGGWEAPPAPQVPTPEPAPRPEPEPDPLTGPLALPPAGSGQDRTPIFEAMESNWFRAGRADRMRSVQVTDRAPQAGPQAGPGAPASPVPPAPQPTAPAGVPGAGAGWRPAGDAQAAVPPWRPSANDERWRQAEALRGGPSTSGVTPSGLPRRTPQANLVAGTAESTTLPGPQVSRSPEEVRGRLTNLRRGVQQARRPGPQDGHGGYRPEQQER